MTSNRNLHVIDDGPIKASGFSSLNNAGQTQTIDGDVYLCRCGESKNRPFCDGSHSKVGFSGANEQKKTYEITRWDGAMMETFFNPNLCMHARYCKPLKDLRARERNGDKAAADEIARVVTTCPSGALTYKMKDGTHPVPFEDTIEIEIVAGGEIRIQCTVTASGIPVDKDQPGNRLTLCRCGLSKNKPFCDASHSAKEGFK